MNWNPEPEYCTYCRGYGHTEKECPKANREIRLTWSQKERDERRRQNVRKQNGGQR